MSAAVGITRTDHTAAGLRDLAVKSGDPAQSRRLLAIAMVLEGSSREDAARRTGMDRQTLRDWVHRYNEAGPAGLMSRTAPGAQPKLSEAQMAELRDLVIAGPDVAIHKVVRWRCVDLRAEVARRFGIKAGESTIAKWLHKFGLTRLQPRPVHPKKDPAAEEAFKKLSFLAERSLARNIGRHADRDLVPGRSPSRPAGHARLYMGADRLSARDGSR